MSDLINATVKTLNEMYNIEKSLDSENFNEEWISEEEYSKLSENEQAEYELEQLDELSSYTKLGKLARKIIPGQGQTQAGERAKDQKYSAGLDRAALKYHPDDKKLATTMKSSEKAEKRYKRISRGEAPFKPSAND